MPRAADSARWKEGSFRTSTDERMKEGGEPRGRNTWQYSPFQYPAQPCTRPTNAEVRGTQEKPLLGLKRSDPPTLRHVQSVEKVYKALKAQASEAEPANHSGPFFLPTQLPAASFPRRSVVVSSLTTTTMATTTTLWRSSFVI